MKPTFILLTLLAVVVLAWSLSPQTDLSITTKPEEAPKPQTATSLPASLAPSEPASAAVGHQQEVAAMKQQLDALKNQEMNRLGLNQGREPADPALEGPWEQRRDAFNEQTVSSLRQFVPQELLDKARIGPPLIELLENDFDKLTPKQP